MRRRRVKRLSDQSARDRSIRFIPDVARIDWRVTAGQQRAGNELTRCTRVMCR
jgi:hypothetical protein